jgi:hypothetical protein
MTVSALIVTLIVSVVVPIVTALLTKATASAGVKQLITAALSAVSGLLVVSTQLDGTAVLSQSAVLLALTTFVASQATYIGLWAPHALDTKVAPGVGLG